MLLVDRIHIIKLFCGFIKLMFYLILNALMLKTF